MCHHAVCAQIMSHPGASFTLVDHLLAIVVKVRSTATAHYGIASECKQSMPATQEVSFVIVQAYPAAQAGHGRFLLPCTERLHEHACCGTRCSFTLAQWELTLPPSLSFKSAKDSDFACRPCLA